MKLYLAQHGDAAPKEQNPDRPLSLKGTADVQNIARFLGRSRITVANVMYSGKLRAKQTAEILTERLVPNITPEINKNIGPLDPPAVVAEEIERGRDDVLLVGHLPHVAKLATLLLTSHEEPAIITFTPGTMACLERDENGHWSLGWLLSPEMVTRKERYRNAD